MIYIIILVVKLTSVWFGHYQAMVTDSVLIDSQHRLAVWPKNGRNANVIYETSLAILYNANTFWLIVVHLADLRSHWDRNGPEPSRAESVHHDQGHPRVQQPWQAAALQVLHLLCEEPITSIYHVNNSIVIFNFMASMVSPKTCSNRSFARHSSWSPRETTMFAISLKAEGLHRLSDHESDIGLGFSLIGGSDYKLIYRHYATLYFVFCVDSSESELGILDLIQVSSLLHTSNYHILI